MNTSLTFGFTYRGHEVTIIGYQIDGGWRMALELRCGADVELIRDTSTVYPDFMSLRSMGIWQAHLKITRKTDVHSSA